MTLRVRSRPPSDQYERGEEHPGAVYSRSVVRSSDGQNSHPRRRQTGLVIAALGVVYGDIGTSPLYALRESLSEEHGIAVNPDNVLGVLSLIIWSLIVVITIKYVVLVLRADHDGEGGILALTAQIKPDKQSGWRRSFLVLGLFGTALLYGDGAITPAISVLSAVEGLEVATPVFEPYIIPIAIVILVVLFLVQFRGTGSIGSVFGTVMVAWFAVLAAVGTTHLFDAPEVFAAFDPSHAVGYFADNGFNAFRSLGSVFLVVTGGEALYADLGHFGRAPIRLGWFFYVLPALLLTYLGQGALLIADPTAIRNPFYLMVPSWGLIPLVILATSATVIASQALISGAFSLAFQSVQLDYLPRMRIRRTSETEAGQIYIPAVNWALMVACIGLVIGFGTSSNLAAAYGVAVTTTMVVTTLLFAAVAMDRWHWSPLQAIAVAAPLLVVDIAFLGANLLKIPHGGWFPLVLAAVVFVVMTTWRDGRELIKRNLRRDEVPIQRVFATLDEREIVRVPGTAIYLHPTPGVAPPAFLANLRANHLVHDSVVVLSVKTESVPRVQVAKRLHIEAPCPGVLSITARFGFAEAPNIPKALAASEDPVFDPTDISYLLGRESIVPTAKPFSGSRARERLFVVMHRNASDAANHFHLPRDRVFEVGRIVEI